MIPTDTLLRTRANRNTERTHTHTRTSAYTHTQTHTATYLVVSEHAEDVEVGVRSKPKALGCTGYHTGNKGAVTQPWSGTAQHTQNTGTY